MSLSLSGTILLFDVPLLTALQYDQSLASTGGTLICPKTTKTLLEEDFVELHSLCTNLHKWVLHQWPWTLRFDDLKRCSPSFLHIREWTLEHCGYIDRATIFAILSMMPALDALRIAYYSNANDGPTPMTTLPRPACRLSRVEIAYGAGLLPCQWLLCNSHDTLKRVSLYTSGAKAEDLLGALEQCKRIEHLSYAADNWIPISPIIDACSRLTSLTIDVEIAVGQAGSLPRTLRELALTRHPMRVFITVEQCQAVVQDVHQETVFHVKPVTVSCSASGPHLQSHVVSWTLSDALKPVSTCPHRDRGLQPDTVQLQAVNCRSIAFRAMRTHRSNR